MAVHQIGHVRLAREPELEGDVGNRSFLLCSKGRHGGFDATHLHVAMRRGSEGGLEHPREVVGTQPYRLASSVRDRSAPRLPWISSKQSPLLKRPELSSAGCRETPRTGRVTRLQHTGERNAEPLDVKSTVGQVMQRLLSERAIADTVIEEFVLGVKPQPLQLTVRQRLHVGVGELHHDAATWLAFPSAVVEAEAPPS